MTWKTHMLGGLLSGTAITVAATELFLPAESHNIVTTCLFVATSTFTALLPDVDEKNSKNNKR